MISRLLEELAHASRFSQDIDSLVIATEELLVKEDTGIRELILTHNGISNILNGLFGTGVSILDCLEYEWYIDHNKFILLDAPDINYGRICYVPTYYVGILKDTLCLITYIYKPDTHFHGFESGILLDRNKFSDHVSDVTLDDSFFKKNIRIIDNKEDLQNILDAPHYDELHLCDVCNNIANIETLKGWVCDRCVSMEELVSLL